MAGNDWKWLAMSGNVLKLFEMAGFVWSMMMIAMKKQM